jgi:hypothetical protein
VVSEGIEKPEEILDPRKHRKNTGLNHGKSHVTTELSSNSQVKSDFYEQTQTNYMHLFM